MPAKGIFNPYGIRRKGDKEQFYTTKETADECVKIMLDHLNEYKSKGMLKHGLDEYTFLEPCAGKGVFCDQLKENGISEDKIIGIDIDPQNKDVVKQDFFDYDVETQLKKPIIVLTNPPFGRGSSQAIKFFNRCAEFAHTIGFIAPMSWKSKFYIHDQLDLRYFCWENKTLTGECFHDENGNNHPDSHLKCVFQIWVYIGIEERKKRGGFRSNDFDFVFPKNRWDRFKKIKGRSIFQKDVDAEWGLHKPEFLIRTHGTKAGTILDGLNHSTRSSIGIVPKTNEPVKEILSHCDFSKFLESHAYIPSLTPAEISWIYEEQKHSIKNKLEK